jgi:hypothetical protein
MEYEPEYAKTYYGICNFDDMNDVEEVLKEMDKFEV